jgi:hypothetical protein
LLTKELEYTKRLHEMQEQIAADARTATGGFSERMAELVQLQPPASSSLTRTAAGLGYG